MIVLVIMAPYMYIYIFRGSGRQNRRIETQEPRRDREKESNRKVKEGGGAVGVLGVEGGEIER